MTYYRDSPLGSNCCSKSGAADVGRNMDAIEELKENVETSPEVTAVRSAGFHLLLDSGEPVEKDDWAASAGLSRVELDDLLASDEVKGRVQFNDEGLLVGVAGLTVEPSAHKINIDGATRYTWCALDAVGILGALGIDGSVHSTDPETGDPIDISFTDGIPDGDATLFILGGYGGGNVISEWCPLVNFFASEDDATSWVEGKGLNGDIVSVAAIAHESAAMWLPVVDATAARDR